MAGGRFDKLIGKERPGTYINFESGRKNGVINAGTRGIVILPLSKATYGPAKKFIKLTTENPGARGEKGTGRDHNDNAGGKRGNQYRSCYQYFDCYCKVWRQQRKCLCNTDGGVYFSLVAYDPRICHKFLNLRIIIKRNLPLETHSLRLRERGILEKLPGRTFLAAATRKQPIWILQHLSTHGKM